MAAELEKLAPFLLKSGAVIRGRESIVRMSGRLAAVWITEDASEPTRRRIIASVDCPVVIALTADDVNLLLGFRNTRVLGLKRSSLSSAVIRELARRGRIVKRGGDHDAAPPQGRNSDA